MKNLDLLILLIVLYIQSIEKNVWFKEKLRKKIICKK
jgi:hypothetical protein